MGFLRGVGYFFSILMIIGGLFIMYANPIIGIVPIVLGIIFIYILRKGAKDEAMRKDIHYLADREKKLDEREANLEEEKKLDEREANLEEEEKKILDKEKAIKKSESDIKPESKDEVEK